MIDNLANMAEGATKPYQDILTECLRRPSTERREFLYECRQRMLSTEWDYLVIYSKTKCQTDPAYILVNADVLYVDDALKNNE